MNCFSFLKVKPTDWSGAPLDDEDVVLHKLGAQTPELGIVVNHAEDARQGAGKTGQDILIWVCDMDGKGAVKCRAGTVLRKDRLSKW